MIIKSETASNHTLVPNAIMDTLYLFCKAKVLLFQIISLQKKEQSVSIDALVDINTNGDHSIRSGIRELEKAGFIHKEITRQKGRITGLEYHLLEVTL